MIPVLEGSGLGAAVDVHYQVGLRDFTIAAGELHDSKEIEADANDVEDA